MSTLILTVTGTPANGPTSSPRPILRSNSSACASFLFRSMRHHRVDPRIDLVQSLQCIHRSFPSGDLAQPHQLRKLGRGKPPEFRRCRVIRAASQAASVGALSTSPFFISFPQFSATGSSVAKLDDFVSAAHLHHGPKHVEGKALGHLMRDRGRHCEFRFGSTTASTRTGPSWANACAMPRSTLGRMFQPDAAHADGLRHCCKGRVLQLRAEVERAGRLLLQAR